MRKLTGFVLILVLIGVSSSLAIQKVAPRLNVVDIYGGYSAPLGEYDSYILYDFTYDDKTFEFEGSDIYKSSFHLGVDYGQVINRHWLASIGFCYGSSNYFEDTLWAPLPDTVGFRMPRDSKFRQYDISFDLHYLVNDLTEQLWSPYVGASVAAGMSGVVLRDFENEYNATIALSLDFGLDVKLWTAPDKRSFVTLASINSWDFLTSGARPKYLQIGGGIKYYFRP